MLHHKGVNCVVSYYSCYFFQEIPAALFRFLSSHCVKPFAVYDWIETSCWLTFLMKATEKVSQETMPWSISSTKAVRVKDNRSPKLQDNTNIHTHTHHRKLVSGRWLGPVNSCKAQMVRNVTGNEQSARAKRGNRRSSMLQQKLLEREKGQRLAMQSRQRRLRNGRDRQRVSRS